MMHGIERPEALRILPRIAVVATVLLAITGCASAAGSDSEPADIWTFLAAGQNEDVTLTGGAELIDDVLVLDGASGFATVAAPDSLDTTSSFTVAAWVSAGSDQGFSTAVSQSGAVAGSFYLGQSEGSYSFSMKDLDTNDEGHTTRAVGDAVVVDPTVWVHLAGVFDATEGSLTVYIDGAEQTTAEFTDPIAVDGPLTLGAAQAHGNPADFWPGSIAGVTIVQKAADSAAIGQLMDTTEPAGESPVAKSEAPADGALEGTWDYAYTPEDLVVLTEQFGGSIEIDGLGPITATRFGFQGSKWWQGFIAGGEVWLMDGHPEGDGGTFEIDGTTLTLDNSASTVDYAWSIDGDALTLLMTDCLTDGAPCEDADAVRWMTEHTYLRSATDGHW